ncbi:MAG TPA: NFACT family protein [Pyrinomonadaceae bacterium]|nr:NFACT family protein [Pyrinomonadaceae bacterium]
MNGRLIEEVVGELGRALVGRLWGKVFQLSDSSLVVEFRSGDGRHLFVSAEPNRPRLYLVNRRVRDLEKESITTSPFAHALRKTLSGARLEGVEKDEGERVVRFRLSAPGLVESSDSFTFVAQLTGRTSNLFLLDGEGRVLDCIRPARGEGQEVGEVYAPPASKSAPEAGRERQGGTAEVSREGFASLSEALDNHYSRMERERDFDSRAQGAAARVRQEIAKLLRLRENLSRDSAAHGDAEEHKKIGDLLLANLGSAERLGRVVRLKDFYTEGEPFIEVEVEENRSLQEEAAERFARYGKAKRAAREISERLESVTRELAALEERRTELEGIIAARDAEALARFTGAGEGHTARKGAPRAGQKGKGRGRGGATVGRRYRSSDGYEIIVGRGSRENDELTFRVARSYDTWLHAADYPGSHVVVRSRGRDDQVPHRTVIEAAQLAAHFSQARKDAKVAVNYTQRKFISKPKGAAPGLVYLSSFRTLLVEPRDELERA